MQNGKFFCRDKNDGTSDKSYEMMAVTRFILLQSQFD